MSEERFRQQWGDPLVGPELRALGLEVPEQLGALFMADADGLRARTAGTPPVVDNYPQRISNTYASMPAALRVHLPWLDVNVSRESFARSPTITRLWPASVRETTLEYFAIQRIINRHFVEGQAYASQMLPVIHHLLTNTPLRTLALWLLHSSAQEQRALDGAMARGWPAERAGYTLGVRALADRDYRTAVEHFRMGAAVYPEVRELIYYQMYALCMLGRRSEARRLAVTAGLATGEHDQDWRLAYFLSETFNMHGLTSWAQQRSNQRGTRK